MAAPESTRIVLAVVTALLLTAATLLTVQMIGDLRDLQRTQTELAELRDVKYGLFNAEVWVEQVSAILAKRIDTFEITDANRPEIKRRIEDVLDRLFVEIDQYLRRRNAQGDNWLERLGGTVRQEVQDWFLDVNELRGRVPAYADAVIDELNRPETRAEIKQSLIGALHKAADSTFSDIDRGALTAILERHDCSDETDCLNRLSLASGDLRSRTLHQGVVVLALVAALFALNILLPRAPEHRARMAPEIMVLLTAATLVLLAGGVMTPMIEVEARIDELRLTLLGEPVTFTDQVLYFQSKSILDVVKVLVDTGAADMILVGVLITLFSLVFPTAKVIAGFLYYADVAGLRRNAVVYFFALRSGKWSMADVLVVAMLMAYIGFSGLISSQLRGMAGAGEDLHLLTTDGTALQLGFFLFLAFVLSSLVLSSLLEARVGRRTS
jgi:hypothetical protein